MKLSALVLSTLAISPIGFANEMVFRLENIPVCTLDVVKNEAEIALYTATGLDEDKYATATLHSNINTKATIKIAGSWEVFSAWGNTPPDSTVAMAFNSNNNFEIAGSNTGEWDKHLSGDYLYPFHVAAISYHKPNNVGSGEFKTIIQVECK